MSRYFGHVLIEFMDGTSVRIGGNRAVTHEGQLVIKTEDSYGGTRDTRWFPLVNIRSWRWENE